MEIVAETERIFTRNEKCGTCGRINPAKGLMINCEREQCGKWHHMECLNLSRTIVLRMKEFYCPACTERSNVITSWKADRQPDEDEVVMKEKEYYPVEEIVDVVDYADGDRDFLVKWRGCPESDNLYVPEEGMDGCLSLLQEFCRKKRIRFSKIVGLIGATNEEKLDRRNWVSADDIVKTVDGFKEDRHALSLQVYEGNFGDRDGLFLYVLEHHAYVVMYYADKNSGYIADGRNTFQSNVYYRSVIQNDLKIPLVALEFNQQTREGHCGGAAVAIALHMMSCYATNTWRAVTIGATRYKRITSRLHKFEAKTIRSEAFKGTMARCKYCKLTFKGAKKLRGLTQHEKFCRSKY